MIAEDVLSTKENAYQDDYATEEKHKEMREI